VLTCVPVGVGFFVPLVPVPFWATFLLLLGPYSTAVALPPCGSGVATTTSGGATNVPSVFRFHVLLDS
jgi:hypothetical protein